MDNEVLAWNKELFLEDKNKVGEKEATLGELAHHRIHIKPKLIVMPFAFESFKKENNLDIQIKHLLGSLNETRHDSLEQVSKYIQKIILKSPVSESLHRKLFRGLEKFREENFILTACYFQNSHLIKSVTINDKKGDAVITSKIRDAWASIYSPENLKKYQVDNQNHHKLSVCITIEGKRQPELSGIIVTKSPKSKNEYEITAHKLVKFVYNKFSERIEEGFFYDENKKDILTPNDLKNLIDIVKVVDRIFLLPQVLLWEKVHGKFEIVDINPAVIQADDKSSYQTLLSHVTLNPGITIGRLNIIDNTSKSVVVTSDEVVYTKNVDRKMLEIVKKAKGIIIEEMPNNDIVNFLKGVGIPALVKKGELGSFFESGNVVSLNTVSGEIKKGSLLVS